MIQFVIFYLLIHVIGSGTSFSNKYSLKLGMQREDFQIRFHYICYTNIRPPLCWTWNKYPLQYFIMGPTIYSPNLFLAGSTKIISYIIKNNKMIFIYIIKTTKTTGKNNINFKKKKFKSRLLKSKLFLKIYGKAIVLLDSIH